MSSPAHAHASPPAVHTLYGLTMGTRWRVDLQAPRAAPLDALHGAAQARLDAIEAQMSTWREDSDLMRYNRAAAGSWHALPGDFFAVMDCALQVAEEKRDRAVSLKARGVPHSRTAIWVLPTSSSGPAAPFKAR